MFAVYYIKIYHLVSGSHASRLIFSEKKFAENRRTIVTINLYVHGTIWCFFLHGDKTNKSCPLAYDHPPVIVKMNGFRRSTMPVANSKICRFIEIGKRGG
jgi:hypothetical protein